MLVSIKWLGRHVDLEGLTPEQICEDLTLSTCEVEGLEPFAPHMASVRVGEVLTREPHPDADLSTANPPDPGPGLLLVAGESGRPG